MTDDEHDNFIAGDDVILYDHSLPVRGKVVKVTPARVTVSYGDGRTQVFHRRKWGRPFDCRRVTEIDLVREACEAEVAAWQRSRPVLRHLAVRFSYGDVSVHLYCEASLETMEQISDETHEIREWLRKRPEEPK